MSRSGSIESKDFICRWRRNVCRWSSRSAAAMRQASRQTGWAVVTRSWWSR